MVKNNAYIDFQDILNLNCRNANQKSNKLNRFFMEFFWKTVSVQNPNFPSTKITDAIFAFFTLLDTFLPHQKKFSTPMPIFLVKGCL